MDRIQGKIAVITGAGSGIGRAAARRFAREGAQVVAIDIRGQEETAQGSDGAITPMRCDVTSPDELQAVFAECERRFGRLDILFNNAGVGRGGKRIHETTLDDWHDVIAVNLHAVFMGIKYGVPMMMRSGGGAIVNTASTQAFRASPTGGGYAPSKAGVVLLTKMAAIEYAPDGIRVNAICPGPTDTAVLAGAAADMRERIVSSLPAGRVGGADEVANLALFLASDEASFITGAAYLVDGGRLLV